MTKYYNHLAVGLDEVKRNFEAYGMLDGQVHFLKGWFKDTLPTAPIDKIAVLRLDGDYYELTRDALARFMTKFRQAAISSSTTTARITGPIAVAPSRNSAPRVA